MKSIIFDLDDTLVDTRLLRSYRDSRRWKDAVRGVGKTSTFFGIPEAIRALENHRIPWAVVTTSVSYYAKAILAHHNLTPSALVAYHDAAPKPHPAPILLALQRLGLTTLDVVGVGDNANDLNAYRNAGLMAVGAGWSPMLAPLDWDFVVMSPTDILTIDV